MINSVNLTGRLTQDPELRYTTNGVAVCTFRLAVNRNFPNKQGERKADFISCVVWRKVAEAITNNMVKGSLLGVTGWLQTRSYENQSGTRVYLTEVVVNEFSFLGSKGTSDQQHDVADTSAPNTAPDNSSSSDPFVGHADSIDITDDDLPF